MSSFVECQCWWPRPRIRGLQRSVVVASGSNTPPKAPRRQRTTFFGRTDQEPTLRTYNGQPSLLDPPQALEDDLFHLRYSDDAEVKSYLEAERHFTDRELGHLRQLQEKLEDELLDAKRNLDQHVLQELIWIPHNDGFEYCERREDPSDNFTKIIRRRKDHRVGVDSEETCVLDGNKVPAMLESEYTPGTYFRGFVRGFNDVRISDDGKMMAYSIDASGGMEVCTVMVKNLQEDRVLNDETIYGVDARIEWDGQGQSLYYMRTDATGRPFEIWRRWLGTQKDMLVHKVDDERFRFSLDRSLSQEYIFIDCRSYFSNSVTALPLSAQKQPSKTKRRDKQKTLLYSAEPVLPALSGTFYSVGHFDGGFVALVRQNDRPAKLVRLTAGEPTAVAEEKDGVSFESFFCLKSAIIVEGRENGQSSVWILKENDNGTGEWSMHSLKKHFRTSTLGVLNAPSSLNKCYDAVEVFLSYTDHATPRYLSRYQFRGMPEQLNHRQLRNVSTKLVFAKAADGALIPISLAFRTDVRSNDQPGPLLLAVYGAYGMCLEPKFTTRILPLLSRGGMYAIAHVRGGGEFGPRWHSEGRLERKEQSTVDFLTCAQHLVDHGLTLPGQLVIEGRSAGGLVIGSAINRRPDLFKAAVGVVPFVDLLGTMVDSSLSLTVGEWEEWGNPNESGHFDHMARLCPIQGVRRQPYPNVLLRPAFKDARTGWWESFKFAQKIREANTDGNSKVLVQMDMEMGHFDDGSRTNTARTRSSILAYILDQLGLAVVEPLRSTSVE